MITNPHIFWILITAILLFAIGFGASLKYILLLHAKKIRHQYPSFKK